MKGYTLYQKSFVFSNAEQIFKLKEVSRESRFAAGIPLHEAKVQLRTSANLSHSRDYKYKPKFNSDCLNATFVSKSLCQGVEDSEGCKKMVIDGLDLSSKCSTLKITITSLAMGGKFAIAGAYAVIYLFSTEQFPTVIKNSGLGNFLFKDKPPD